MGRIRRIPGVKRCRAVPEKVWSEKPKSGKRHNAKTNLELHSIVLLYRTPLCRPVIQKFVDALGRSFAIGRIHYWSTLCC